jgi:pyruvate-ferredoxin/flavodoxin oxidoreductase
MTTFSETALALMQVEAAVGGTVLASEATASGLGGVGRAATPSAAIRDAIAATRAGARASVVLAPDEVLGALDGLAAAAVARAPIVVHVVPVGGAPGALSTGRDELAPALDVGAGVVVSWAEQDAVDVAIALHRAAEDSETPFLHLLDVPAAERAPGSATSLPDAAAVTRFLGAARPAGAGVADGVPALRKRAERGFAARVPFALTAALREVGDLFGRPLGAVERFETTDADEIVVAVGSAFLAARDAARALRREGKRVGAVGLRALRPFFGAEVVKAVARARAIVVAEPLDLALAPCGPAASGLKAAFADALTWAPGFPGVGRIPPIVSAAFATVDGAVRERDVRLALDEIAAGERARRLVVFGSDQG